MKVKTDILLRIYVLYGLIFLGAVAVLVKIYLIQNYKDDFWVEKAKKLSMKWVSVLPERGNIYTERGDLLATSMPYYELSVDFASPAMSNEIFESNVDSLAFYMSRFFGKKSEKQYGRELRAARNAKKRGYLLGRRIDYQSLQEIKKWPLLREGKFTGGLVVNEVLMRRNPYGNLAQRTLGSFSPNTPLVGLEASYDSYLAGVKGLMLKQKFAGGIWMPVQTKDDIVPQSGVDIVTTLDVNLQDVAEKALKEALELSQAKFGCVVMMEVKTGAIKVMANLGEISKGRYGEIQNYAVSHRSEPGSTFKAASYLMLLDKKGLKLSDTIHVGNGVYNFYGRLMREDHFVAQDLTVIEAFYHSSNISAAKLIDRNYRKNKNEFYKTLQKYGLTSESGIDLVGENPPIVSKPDKWSNISLPWRATGYEQTYSPLQILTFYNTIANNGYRATPYLISRIEKNGSVIKEIEHKVSKNRIAGDYALKAITEMMKSVVENPKGTAKNIKSDYVSIAGKTGTAKLYDPETKRYGKENQAMFCGFFPVDNPQYSCIVMVYKPQGPKTGGGIAAPIFKELAEKSMTMNFSASPEYVISAEDEPKIIAEIKGEVDQLKNILERYDLEMNLSDDILYADVSVKKSGLAIKTLQITDLKIPDLTGMNIDDAYPLLENMGLKVQFTGMGKVIAQSIQPGTQPKKGDKITLILRI